MKKVGLFGKIGQKKQGSARDIFFFTMFFLMCGVMGSMIYQWVQIDSIIRSKGVSFNINGIPEYESYYGEISDLLILGQRFADYREYNDSYKCENYSEEFRDIAQALGFDVWVETGCKNENMTDCHAWNQVAIDYEPQTGSFDDFSKKYPYR